MTGPPVVLLLAVLLLLFDLYSALRGGPRK